MFDKNRAPLPMAAGRGLLLISSFLVASRLLPFHSEDRQTHQRRAQIPGKIKPHVADLPASAGDKELNRLIRQRRRQSAQQHGRKMKPA